MRLQCLDERCRRGLGQQANLLGSRLVDEGPVLGHDAVEQLQVRADGLQVFEFPPGDQDRPPAGVAEPADRRPDRVVHVPVPGLATPYTVVLAELGDTGVRTLVRLTGAPPGSVAIGDRGRMVFRRVAVRMGVPDYGYAFLPVANAGKVAA